MNKNRAQFLEDNAKLLLELSKAPLEELKPLLKPGATSAIEWLKTVREHPGSTYKELAHYMDAGVQVAQQTMAAFAKGGVIYQEDLESDGATVGPQGRINFIAEGY